jgi:hypothetical protein
MKNYSLSAKSVARRNMDTYDVCLTILPVFLAQAAHFLRVISDGLMISSVSALGRVTAMTFSCTQTVIGKFGAIAKRVPKIVKAQTSISI